MECSGVGDGMTSVDKTDSRRILHMKMLGLIDLQDRVLLLGLNPNPLA